MESLREIIAKEGTVQVAARLRMSEAYMRHILKMRRRAGERLLAKARRVYGKRLDVVRTLADNDQVEYGAQATSPEAA